MISQNLGWTLIHSLWQGLAIFVVLKIAVRAVRTSDVKYAMGVAAMALMVIASVITFFVLNAKPSSDEFHITLNATQASSNESWSILDFVNQNIIWLIRFWAIGFVVGLLRIAAGLIYIKRLRTNSHPVQEEWMDMVKRLSESLNINRVVAMAEAGISSPMVVGFMKPVILFPVGLLSGLTAEQVETILVHELSHIRRQDYIINLVQSVIETIFFFNPFALLISSMIRNERENCCDDIVIAKGISPITYVKTLAQLEAARSSTSLALGFASNQNQLLNRIKRIMENSAKNDWGKGRLVPVALLFLGLVCASWLSINSEKEIEVQQELNKNLVLSADTIIINMPEPPDASISFFKTPVRELDSIPDLEAFEREFTQKFKMQFKDFYDKNQIEFEKMFEEAKHGQSKRREALELVDLDDFTRMAQIQKEIADIHAIAAQDMAIAAQDMAFQAIKDQEVAIDVQKRQMDVMIEDQARMQHIMFDDMHRQSEACKEAMVKMLIEDGYIGKNDILDGLSINDSNGKITINGHKIKDKDAVKYRAIRDQYFGDFKKKVLPGRSE